RTSSRCFSNARRLCSSAWSSDSSISEGWSVSSAYLTITRWRTIWTVNSARWPCLGQDAPERDSWLKSRRSDAIPKHKRHKSECAVFQKMGSFVQKMQGVVQKLRQTQTSLVCASYSVDTEATHPPLGFLYLPKRAGPSLHLNDNTGRPAPYLRARMQGSSGHSRHYPAASSREANER